MTTFIFVLHLFSCFFLIGLILLQKGKGAEMGAAFGGASQTVFGSRGPATFLNKLTIIIAAIFLGASIYLANAAKGKESNTVVDKTHEEEVKKLEEAAPVIEKEVTPAAEEGAKGGEKKE